jgi:hypothetical protein
MFILTTYIQLENEICPHVALVPQEDEARFIWPEVVPVTCNMKPAT